MCSSDLAMALRCGHLITDKHMFPITSTPAKFVDAVRRHRLGGLPAEAQAIIEGLQPHAGRNEPLRWLDSLHNTDKHRTLNVTTIASMHTHFVWGDGGHQIVLGSEELRDGAKLPIGVPLSNPMFTTLVDRLYKVKVEGECALFVAFEELAGESEDLEPFGVALVLHEISEFVRCSVLPNLYPFLN